MNIQWVQSVVDSVPACLFENRLRFLARRAFPPMDSPLSSTIMHPATPRRFDGVDNRMRFATIVIWEYIIASY